MLFITLLSLLGAILVLIARKVLKNTWVINASGKCVLVTGAASGIGLQLCLDLVEKQSFVIACDINQTALSQAFEKFDESQVYVLPLDITNIESIENTKRMIQLKLGDLGKTRLFAIVNCAGTLFNQYNPIGRIIDKTDKGMEWMYRVNVFGTINVNRIMFSLLQSNDQCNESGCIVNMGSIAGYISTPLFGHYSPTKHGMLRD